MGTNIHGYVEINPIKESDADVWLVVIDIGSVVEQDYRVFARLFGVRVKQQHAILADHRGLPTDSVNHRQHHITLSEDVVHHSWVTWQEINDFMPQHLDLDVELWGWHWVFNSMQTLAARFGAENVRLVVAFDNYG